MVLVRGGCWKVGMLDFEEELEVNEVIWMVWWFLVRDCISMIVSVWVVIYANGLIHVNCVEIVCVTPRKG